MLRKFRSLWLTFLAVVLVLQTLGACGYAASAEVTEHGWWGELYWSYSDDGILSIRGNGAMPDYDAFGDPPWTHLSKAVNTVVIEEGVTEISDYAFFDFQNLYTVRLPNSLVKIGYASFYGCKNLTWLLDSELEMRLPNGIESIGDTAFGGCERLESVVMGSNVSYLGDNAFGSCTGLAQIQLSPALRYIGNYAFQYCTQLRSIYFPANISYIGDYAFLYCCNITEISFAGNAPDIQENAFYFYDEPLAVVARYPEGDPTWSGEKRANYGAALNWKSIKSGCIADGSCGENVIWRLEQDGTLRFSGYGPMSSEDNPWLSFSNQIAAGVIEEGVTSICDLAFYKCFYMQNVTIADSVTTIGMGAFMDCDSLLVIHLGAYVTYIDEWAFQSCEGLKAITVAQGNTCYTSDPFGVLFDKNMETLIAAPTGISGDYHIPYGVEVIDQAAFYSCTNLSEITIPDTVTTIGNSAFSCCYDLRSVTIPASVTLIDHDAFWYCHGLEKIEFHGDAPCFVGESVFVNVSATATYPAGNSTWTEDKMVHPDSNITWVAAEPVVELPNITLCYPTLLLEDEIKMMVYYTINQDIHLERMGMLTWTSKPDVVSVHTADAVISGASFDPVKGLYSVTTQGIPAQNLGDEIYFSIYAELSDGNLVYSNPVKYSPTTYAYNQLNGGADAPTKALYVAILNYGAAAQKFLNYKTDALANANLTDEQKALVVPFHKDMVQAINKPNVTKQGTLAANGGFTAKNPTISLDSAFAINYYFTPSAEVAGNMAFYYWNAADFTAADVLSTDNATGSYAMVNENGVYGAAIKGIAAKDINSAVYVCGVYTDVNGNSYSTGILSYSLGCYCGNQAKGEGSLADLAAAIAVYGYYATDYFA